MNKYFSVLGVSPNATIQEVKKAYRKKVMLYHPDRNKSPSANSKFIEIDEAYDYICNLRSGKITQATYVKKAPTPEEKRRKAFRKAEIVKEFMYQSQKLEREANTYYVLVCLPSMLILPILGAYIGHLTGSGLVGFVLFLGLPAASIYWLCKRVYDSFVPRRRKLSKEMKMKIRSL